MSKLFSMLPHNNNNDDDDNDWQIDLVNLNEYFISLLAKELEEEETILDKKIDLNSLAFNSNSTKDLSQKIPKELTITINDHISTFINDIKDSARRFKMNLMGKCSEIFIRMLKAISQTYHKELNHSNSKISDHDQAIQAGLLDCAENFTSKAKEYKADINDLVSELSVQITTSQNSDHIDKNDQINTIRNAITNLLEKNLLLSLNHFHNTSQLLAINSNEINCIKAKAQNGTNSSMLDSNVNHSHQNAKSMNVNINNNEEYSFMRNAIETMKSAIQNKDSAIKQMSDSIKMSSEGLKEINKYKQLYEREKEEKKKVIQHSQSLAQSLKDLLRQKEIPFSQSRLSSSPCFQDTVLNTKPTNCPDSNKRISALSPSGKLIQKQKELTEAKLKLLKIEKENEALSLSLNESNSLIDSLKKTSNETTQSYLSLQEEYNKLINSNSNSDPQYKIKSMQLNSTNEDLKKILLKIKTENDSISKELNDNRLAMMKDKELSRREKDSIQKSLSDLNQLLTRKDNELLFVTQRLNDEEKGSIEKDKKIRELLCLHSASSSGSKGIELDRNIIRNEIEDKDNDIHKLKDIVERNQRLFFNEQNVLNDKIIQLSLSNKDKREENDELKARLKQIEEQKQATTEENNKLRKFICSLNNQLKDKVKEQDSSLKNKIDITNATPDIAENEFDNKENSSFTKLDKAKQSNSQDNYNDHNNVCQKDSMLFTDLKDSNQQLMTQITLLQNEVNRLSKQNSELKGKLEELKNQLGHKPKSSSQQIPQSHSRINQLEQNYSSAKELINSLKRNNEETNKLLKESLIENKQLKEYLNTLNADDNQYSLINVVSQFKILIIDLVQKHSPHLIPIHFTSTPTPTQKESENEAENQQKEDKYYDLVKVFNEDLTKTGEKLKKYKEMMKRMSKIIQNSQKEQQTLLSLQSDLLNKISNREAEFNEYKMQMKTIIVNGNSNDNGNSINDLCNTIPFEKYQQILQVFAIEEEKYKQDIEALRQENNKIRKAMVNQSNIQMSLSSSFISDNNNKPESPNVSFNAKELLGEDSRSLISRGYYNVNFIEKKFDEDEQLFKDQLELIKEELKIAQKELKKYESLRINNGEK